MLRSSIQFSTVLSSRHLLLSLADSGIHQRTRLVPVWRVLSSLAGTDVLPVGSAEVSGVCSMWYNHLYT